jgi:predicted enzyme related to lactoylglutathione lyase
MFIQFAELPVFNQDRAKSFYIDQFDCRVVADTPMAPDGWRWIEMKFQGAETTLHFLRRPDEMPSNGPTLVLIDDDVEGTISALAERGVKILTDPKAAPYAANKTVAEIEDSEGNRIVISSR